jgi:hypothetical protein
LTSLSLQAEAVTWKWEQKTDPNTGIGFMVTRHGAYHARADARDDG